MFFPTLPFLPWSANKLAATAIFAGKGAKLRGFASQDEVAVLHQINTWVADSDFLDRWAFPASFRKPDFSRLDNVSKRSGLHYPNSSRVSVMKRSNDRSNDWIELDGNFLGNQAHETEHHSPIFNQKNRHFSRFSLVLSGLV